MVITISISIGFTIGLVVGMIIKHQFLMSKEYEINLNHVRFKDE